MGSSNKFDVQLLNLDLSTAHFTNENFGHSDPGFKLAFKEELLNLDRGHFLALYLVLGVSCALKIPFAYTKDTSRGSLDTEPVSWFWFANTDFVYRARP